MLLKCFSCICMAGVGIVEKDRIRFVSSYPTKARFNNILVNVAVNGYYYSAKMLTDAWTLKAMSKTSVNNHILKRIFFSTELPHFWTSHVTQVTHVMILNYIIHISKYVDYSNMDTHCDVNLCKGTLNLNKRFLQRDDPYC